MTVNFQGRHSPGFSRVQLSEQAFLKYIHSSETLTLTLNHIAEHLLEADIKLFRKYFWDRAFLLKVLEDQEARPEERQDMPSSAAETEEEIKNLVTSRSSPEKEDVKCVENLVVQPNDHEDRDSLDSVAGPLELSRRACGRTRRCLGTRTSHGTVK
ncbi:rho guanine nucleotide exchange factor 28-like, partial [Leptonychotes weddellii]|uniref:Rho guanine nucleotide exchange factor 28-like n=1 Tax=Leptonychotes weddellii TaxID=9713 RepID=A0A7F8QCZ3_LEPWE